MYRCQSLVISDNINNNIIGVLVVLNTETDSKHVQDARPSCGDNLHSVS